MAAEVARVQDAGENPRKRRIGRKKGGKGKKKPKVFPVAADKVRIDRKMKKLFRRRARDYNSDDDDDDEENEPSALTGDVDHAIDGNSSDEEDGDDQGNEGEDDEASEDEDSEIQPAITKFTEGCKPFRVAFKKITKKSVSDDLLGPVLSAHKKLVAEKLAEEEAERKAKGEAKKEKHLAGEKGHVKPGNFLDAHEKFLIGVATKGVVKLFNAVNKAQHAQKGLDPSRSKDAKAMRKQRKAAFFSELGKTSSSQPTGTLKVPSSGSVEGEGPSWAPLRDNFMLTSSKLKDWDKMPDAAVADDLGTMASDSSSDNDD